MIDNASMWHPLIKIIFYLMPVTIGTRCSQNKIVKTHETTVFDHNGDL